MVNKTTKSNIFYLILILVICTFWMLPFFYPEPKILVTPDYGRSDAWHYNYAVKSFLSQKISANRLPVWSASTGTGFPFLAEGPIGTFFLPNLIFLKLFGMPAGYNLLIWFSLVTAAAGLYLWLRELEINPFISFWSGLTLVFSATMITQLTHLSVIQAMTLFPLIGYLVTRMINRSSNRNFSILTAAISQQILSGFPQAVFITVLTLGIYAFLMVKIRKTGNKALLLLSASAILALGLSSVQLFPSYEFLQQTPVKSGFTLDEAIYFSYPPAHFLTLIYPFWLGNPAAGTYPHFSEFSGSMFWENSAFIGIIPVLIFIVALFMMARSLKQITGRKSSGPEITALCIILVSVFLMLGKHSPFYILFTFWPFNLFRVPSRFIWPAVIFLIIFDAAFLNRYWHRIRKRIKIVLILMFLLNTASEVYYFRGYHLLGNAADYLKYPETVSYIDSMARTISIGAEKFYNREFTEYGWKHPAEYLFFNNLLQPHINLVYRISTADIFTARPTARYSYLNGLYNSGISESGNVATISSAGQKYLDILNVKNIITPDKLDCSGCQFVHNIIRNKKEINVYRKTSPRARFYLADHAFKAATVKQAANIINSEEFIPAKSAVVEKDLKIAGVSPEDRISVKQDSDTYIRLSVETDEQPSLLVVADTYYPGWQAEVNGSKADIIPVNLAQKGIVLPGTGKHDVILKYTPKSLLYGQIASIFSLFILIISCCLKPLWKKGF